MILLVSVGIAIAGPSPVRIEEKQHGEVDEAEAVPEVDDDMHDGHEEHEEEEHVENRVDDDDDDVDGVPHVVPVAIKTPDGPDLCLTEHCIAASNRYKQIFIRAFS